MNNTLYKASVLAALLVSPFGATGAAEAAYVNLGGPATGYLAIFNAKNSTTQNGIEGKNADGTFNPTHNGLPEYPNFQIPTGFTNAGVYTAVIASPQSTTADYSAFSGQFYGGAPISVNNQLVNQPGFSTLSAGRIDYDNSLVSPIGASTIGVAGLSFDFNTFLWDGNVTPGQTGDPRSNFNASYASPASPIAISPFSPVYQPYNDGSGAGNAQFFYQLSIGNVTGSGLSFQDGELVSMDLQGDITVRVAGAPFFNATTGAGSVNFTGGAFTASGLGYEFNVSGIRNVSIFSNIHLLMNRAGTASLVPEPGSLLLAVPAAAALLRRRR
jgi:hypothetical protein